MQTPTTTLVVTAGVGPLQEVAFLRTKGLDFCILTVIKNVLKHFQ